MGRGALGVPLTILIEFAPVRSNGVSSGPPPVVDFLPVVAVVVVGLIAWRVYVDACARFARGHPVVLRIGALQIDSPRAWGIACFLCCVVFVPYYLALTASSR